jgi:cephalosporin hydroxylase
MDHTERVARNIQRIADDNDFLSLSASWVQESILHEYAQSFSWMGRPIMQIPQDIYAIQELIWHVRPDLIIETGVAHGGSLILSASLLALLDYSDAASNRSSLLPNQSKRRVVGVDIDIRPHNRSAIEEHPMSHLITLIQGSSIDLGVVQEVKRIASYHDRVMVFLDSNHIHDHVLAELMAYAPLTSKGSYCVVWDTGIEDLPANFYEDRPWGKGNNPKTAVFEYLRLISESDYLGTDNQPLLFEIDKSIEHKIVLTASQDGFLKRV